MVGNLRFGDRGTRANAIGLCIVAVLSLLAAYAGISLEGTKTGAALSLMVSLGPLVLYWAIVAPAVIPFGLYITLVPLDGLLGFTQVASLTRIVGLASAGALLFYMLRTKRAVEPARATMLWVLFYLWAAASLFWAVDPATSTALLPTELQLFGLYVVVAMFPINKQALQITVLVTVIATAAAAAYGVYFYHTGGAQLETRLALADATGGLNPDHFAGAMILPTTLALVALFWTRKFWVRAVCVVGIIAMLWAMDLTGARGAIVGLGAGLLYLLIRDGRHRVPIAIFLGALGAAVVFITKASIIDRFAQSSVNGGAGRLDIWRVGWLAFKENWLVGAGYNNFPFAFDRAFMQVPQAFYTHWHRASHNILLHNAVELGVIGLVLFLAAWIGQFRITSFIGPKHSLYPLRLGLEASIAGLFVAGLFADIMTQKYPWLAFMLIALLRNAALVEKEPVPECAPS